jgi:hypothetical protein
MSDNRGADRLATERCLCAANRRVAQNNVNVNVIPLPNLQQLIGEFSMKTEKSRPICTIIFLISTILVLVGCSNDKINKNNNSNSENSTNDRSILEYLPVPAVKIIVNQRHVGFTSSMEEAMELIKNVKLIVNEERIEAMNAMTDDKVSYVSLLIDKKVLEDNKASVDAIVLYVTTYISGYGISINNRIDIVLATEEEAQSVLEDLKAYYFSNSVSDYGFDETVLVVETKTLPLEIKTKQEAMETLTD